MAAAERDGQAAERAHGGGPERRDVDEQIDVDVDPERGREQHAGDRDETRPDGPGVAADHDGVGRLERQEGGRVDDRLHGDAEAGPLEEEVEADGGADGQSELDQLAAQDRHAEEVDPLDGRNDVNWMVACAVRAGQTRTRAARSSAIVATTFMAADAPVSQNAMRSSRSEPSEADQDQRSSSAAAGHGQPEGLAERVEDVGRGGGLGADGEVEDARRLVREDQAERGQRVDRAVGEPGDDVGADREGRGRARGRRPRPPRPRPP